MILLCEVISLEIWYCSTTDDLNSRGHISADLRQELIGRRRVCECLCSKLWFVVRPMACSQRRECGRYVCLCLFSYQSSNPPPSTHTPQSLWRKWGGGVERARSNNKRLQENAAKYCHPLLHCSTHSRDTSTRCQILLWKDDFIQQQWGALTTDVPGLSICKTVGLYSNLHIF